MTKHPVGSAAELDAGDRLLVELEGKDVGIFNLGGKLYAYLNWCVHQGGPCCEGKLEGTVQASFDRDTLETELEYVREGEILCCPWHGWEFDVTTGECLSQQGYRLPSYAVSVEDGEIVVEL